MICRNKEAEKVEATANAVIMKNSVKEVRTPGGKSLQHSDGRRWTDELSALGREDYTSTKCTHATSDRKLATSVTAGKRKTQRNIKSKIRQLYSTSTVQDLCQHWLRAGVRPKRVGSRSKPGAVDVLTLRDATAKNTG